MCQNVEVSIAMKILPHVGRCLLKQLLDQRHMSPLDLSIKTGISLQQISGYLHNHSCMSLKNARKIAKELGDCYIDDLYTWDDE